MNHLADTSAVAIPQAPAAPPIKCRVSVKTRSTATSPEPRHTCLPDVPLYVGSTPILPIYPPARGYIFRAFVKAPPASFPDRPLPDRIVFFETRRPTYPEHRLQAILDRAWVKKGFIIDGVDYPYALNSNDESFLVDKRLLAFASGEGGVVFFKPEQVVVFARPSVREQLLAVIEKTEEKRREEQRQRSWQ
ncbi:hypothetical protein D5039_00225 [Verminephrobacter aporrectodeae subsp. tuberculatae]|uniref:Uncharacterized protein n=1 Tax=Verminephrobacter aporrectodeae subsp. tuberculatae TaxID=1110392 RepID=A0ABT3KMW3_9BURK|nr:hypothetical protein [Verminephrobacter aporrectodeae]MCW5319661.1 hypothetical protein [Verminephrobacter aporrectodeae subsp. tuberculatae]